MAAADPVAPWRHVSRPQHAAGSPCRAPLLRTSTIRANVMRSGRLFFCAAVLTSILAAEILELSAELTYYVISDPPIVRSGDAAHSDFHIMVEAGFSLMGAVLLLFLAWSSLRKGETRGFWVLLVAGLPTAVLPPLAYQLLGPWHAYVLYPPVLWLLSVAAAGAGLFIRYREACNRPFSLSSRVRT